MSDFQVLASVKKVIAQSEWVSFHPGSIRPSILKWGGLVNLSSDWEHPCHFFDGTQETVRWIFSLDILNHCFWADAGEPVWTVTYRGKPYSGYWGLAASLKHALERGLPITDPRFLSGISANHLAEIFSGEGRIPMFEARLKNLREAGSIILSELNGDILSLFDVASGSATRLVREIVSHFPSFRDEAVYGSEKIYFWKRAQIFVSDVFSAFGGNGWGKLHDMEQLTAFADYKLPQVLRELGIISYHHGLAAKVDAQECIKAGSGEEIEIRAMTIWAVEELKKDFQKKGQSLTSPQVDNWLWRLGQMEIFRKRPYHRCSTIFY